MAQELDPRFGTPAAQLWLKLHEGRERPVSTVKCSSLRKGCWDRPAQIPEGPIYGYVCGCSVKGLRTKPRGYGDFRVHGMGSLEGIYCWARVKVMAYVMFLRFGRGAGCLSLGKNDSSTVYN